MLTRHALSIVTLTCLIASRAGATDANRLIYLDSNDPYYPNRTFPKLITPQWVGEENVDAVIILAIDDMRGHEKWEKFLRPILDRLKQIDGRAPISIMTCQIDPADPHLQLWLKEGLSLETHTFDHPCPLMADGNFARAKSTYDKCVDQMFDINGNAPVAFRMPCCDSMDTPSPRFYSEIFNKQTPKNHFLSIDSSVFTITTPNDPALPRDLVFDPDGRERFRKYLPFKSFVNTIEDYPYPYVIGKLCWEFPCIVPSDWEANHIQGPCNSKTVDDMKAALDAVVLKQGVYNLVFHPHGWIKPEQIIDLIDHATTKYGKRIKFLSFKEAQDRLNKNLLANQPLRAADGTDNGVRLLDINNDGYIDVIIANENLQQTRVWSPKTRAWRPSDFPAPIVKRENNDRSDTGVRFGIIDSDGYPSILQPPQSAWHFGGTSWQPHPALLKGLDPAEPLLTAGHGHETGIRFRDLDHDGRCELIISNPHQQAIYTRDKENKTWLKLPFTLPPNTTIVDANGHDAGLRFVDIDEDGYDDILFSNDGHYSLHLFTSMQQGWTRELISAAHGEQPVAHEIPKIVRNGTDNGAWIHSRHLWWRNESTAALPDNVDRRSFNALLGESEPGPKSPEAALKSIHVAPGFQVEQMAAEPLTESPIAFAWAPDGKLWVVEMGDYPLGVDGKGKPGGRVRFLESTHNDGKYDKSTVFLENLPFPTGVMPWGKGVLVTCAPDIFYAEDSDGDGKADLRTVLYTGFREGNQQHRVNSLVYGLDNWIYCANGHSGGQIKSIKNGQIVDISGRDFRIRPNEGLIEATTGITQYGRSRDDWNNWFGNDNSNPMFHFVLEDHYLRRNPNAATAEVRVPVSVKPGPSQVYPISRTLARFNDPSGANHFTSANSAIVYRDDLFGPLFNNSTFVSEPVHNLIHREIISPLGVTFTSQRAPSEQESEFLASTDNWFRPTMLQTGPDGALWFADIYRAVIEHPEWIPKDWQKRLDLRAGHDRGRIYRIYPISNKPRPFPRLDQMRTPALVKMLESPNGWQRDTAQRLLIEQHDPDAIPMLKLQFFQSHNELCRLHSLCTLDAFSAADEGLLRSALMLDRFGNMPLHALRIAEPSLAKSSSLLPAMIALVDDGNPQVRLQLAYTLGYSDDPVAAKALGQLGAKNVDDRFITAAVLSSLTPQNIDIVAGEMLAALTTAPPPALLTGLIRSAQSFGGPTKSLRLLATVATPARDGTYAPWRYAAVASMLDALDQSGLSLNALLKQSPDAPKADRAALDSLFESARTTAADERAPLSARAPALHLACKTVGSRELDMRLPLSFLSPLAPPELQSIAAADLAKRRDPATTTVLLNAWKTYSPTLRAQILDALLTRSEGAQALLDAIEHHRILPTDIDIARRQRLLQNKSAPIRARASSLLATAASPDRAKVVESFHDVLSLKGDPAHGREVFAKTCAICHRLGDAGSPVGPDLASIGNKSPESLLVSILDPNQAVEPRYTNYIVDTRAGETFSGVLAAETGNSINLAIPGGQQLTLLRSDLKSLRSTGLSLMPEGLEVGLTHQDLADLIAAVGQSGAPRVRKTFEKNRPELIAADNNGELHLHSTNCEIYGPTLVLETQYNNLGFWSSPDDQAVWSVQVPSAGKYLATLHYACDESSAGNPFIIQSGASELPGAVPSTGSWDTYRHLKIGEIALAAGRQQIVLRPSAKPNGALLDFKEIELTPILNPQE